MSNILRSQTKVEINPYKPKAFVCLQYILTNVNKAHKEAYIQSVLLILVKKRDVHFYKDEMDFIFSKNRTN